MQHMELTDKEIQCIHSYSSKKGLGDYFDDIYLPPAHFCKLSEEF